MKCAVCTAYVCTLLFMSNMLLHCRGDMHLCGARVYCACCTHKDGCLQTRAQRTQCKCAINAAAPPEWMRSCAARSIKPLYISLLPAATIAFQQIWSASEQHSTCNAHTHTQHIYARITMHYYNTCTLRNAAVPACALRIGDRAYADYMRFRRVV